MEVTERTRVGPAPAWPTLMGVHLVVLAVLVGAWWRGSDGTTVRRGPTEARIHELAPGAGQAVEQAVAQARRTARALPAGDERRVKSFLSLTAAASGLELTEARFEAERPVTAGALPIAAWLELRGDAYDLPVFLDGLHRQASLVRVDGVVCRIAPGGQADARVLLRFHRPVLPDATALGDRVDRTAPTAPPSSRAALLAAGELAAWRAFAATEPARAALAASHRARLQRELPAALVAAWSGGGTVTWAPGSADAAP